MDLSEFRKVAQFIKRLNIGMDDKRKDSDKFDGSSTQILKRIITPEYNQPDKTPTLIVIKGTDSGKIFKFVLPSMSIGRESCTDICLNDEAVSRKHCLLVSSESSIMLIDLQSSNGTLVNGDQIEKSKLKNGDKITVGNTILRFELADHEVDKYHEKIYKQITFDDLTSLYNRKSMQKELELRFSAISKFLPFSMLFVDIDHFKKVNDTYGHITGSKILTELGRLFLSNLRAVDVACRYGGEEFVLIINQSNSQAAAFVAEKLREIVEKKIFVSHKGERMFITVSIGIAEATPDIKNYQDLIDRADEAMYRAKNGGRNQTILYVPGSPPTFLQIKK